ncbi:type IV pilin-like G/H family protein [Pseudanabaena sp. lw0831]|uniref:type IV pilin-like G/H family protein n=1 Tax=Pseudanabaena sp. lw0831 TaxID=1357935 RepID=UPI001F2D9D0E|nr:type IV pilin-like G/H family protein [Pseudanabaena sp. lw0831]
MEKVRFAPTIRDLGVIDRDETENYKYRIFAPNSEVFRRNSHKIHFSLGVAVYQIGQAKKPNLESYVGAVRFIKVGDNIMTNSIICETDSASTSEPPFPVLIGDNQLKCAPGTHDYNSRPSLCK